MTEIEVVDPRHPLFGRRFPLLSASSPPDGGGHAFVRYRQTLTLRLPIAVTTLAPPRPTPQTTLTCDAVTELVTLAEGCEGLCRTTPPTSGIPSPPTCATGSATTSLPSARR